MRPLHAFKNAMRKRRTRRIDLDEADRLAAGDPTAPRHAGLGTLLDTLRAPATPGELATEKATVAAFTAHRKRAARAARRNRRTRPHRSNMAPARALVTPLTTALALLIFGGTALAARTGNLPDGAQQHAHRLFSALGVPAPRTGPHHPSPSPSASATPPAVELGWCADWQPGGPSLSSENHQRLRTAAGSEQRIPGYCDTLRRSAAPSPSVSVTPPSAPSPGDSTPTGEPTSGAPPTTLTHPPPAHPTPSHSPPAPGGPGPGTRPQVPPP